MTSTLAPGRHDMNQIVGSHDIVFLVLDTLRYDVAVRCLDEGRTPNLAKLLPGGRWEERWSPGNFTYAAHQAFFAGFLPTPVGSGPHPRLFAARFPGSESTASTSFSQIWAARTRFGSTAATFSRCGCWTATAS